MCSGPVKLALCAGVVKDYTVVVREAIAAKQAWLAAAEDVMFVDKRRLDTLKAAATLAPEHVTLEDAAQDYPYGPFDTDCHEDEEDAGDGDDAVVLDDSDDDDGAEEIDAELRHAVRAAADIGVVPADAMELDLAAELAEPDARDDGPATAVDPEVEEDDPDAPRGAVGRTMAAGGKVVEMHISHQVALAIIQSRCFHVHKLTIRPETGKSAVPYPTFMRLPRSHVEFEVDLMLLSHDDGHALMEDLEGVLHGTLPVIPARACNLDATVRKALAASDMCLVMGCPDRVHLGTERALLLCPKHRRADVRVRGTEEDMRRCTGCHKHLDVREFRHGQGIDGDGGVCRTCSVLRRNRDAGRGQQQPLPAHMPASPAEAESGRDADGSFILERRAAEQQAARLLDVRPGESLNSPYIAYAFYDEARRGHLRRCVRIGCSGEAKLKNRDGAMLCKKCFDVRA